MMKFDITCTLAELEDSLDVALKDKEAQKKMSKANGRARMGWRTTR